MELETAMSRTLLYTKIKVHTGFAPNEFIRIIHMNWAMDLLKSGQYTISKLLILSVFMTLNTSVLLLRSSLVKVQAIIICHNGMVFC